MVLLQHFPVSGCPVLLLISHSPGHLWGWCRPYHRSPPLADRLRPTRALLQPLFHDQSVGSTGMEMETRSPTTERVFQDDNPSAVKPGRVRCACCGWNRQSLGRLRGLCGGVGAPLPVQNQLEGCGSSTKLQARMTKAPFSPRAVQTPRLEQFVAPPCSQKHPAAPSLPRAPTVTEALLGSAPRWDEASGTVAAVGEAVPGVGKGCAHKGSGKTPDMEEGPKLGKLRAQQNLH